MERKSPNDLYKAARSERISEALLRAEFEPGVRTVRREEVLAIALFNLALSLFMIPCCPLIVVLHQ